MKLIQLNFPDLLLILIVIEIIWNLDKWTKKKHCIYNRNDVKYWTKEEKEIRGI